MDAPGAPVIPGFARVVEAVEGTEVLLAAAAANGVEKIFFNGGTDNFHFMEHVAKFKALGRPTPDLVMTTHEHTGLCAAIGYFQWTRKPQLLVVHVAIGTMQPGGAWEEAWKVKAGVVVLAGTPGQTTKNELGYTTRNGIQFTQEIYHQETMLGSYAKWAYKIERIENAALVMNRAFQMAASEPCGVSYLTYPMEVALAPMTGGLVYDAADFAPAPLGEGDGSALREAARLLVQAKNPVVMVKGMGRHPEAVQNLVALAEKLALPISSSDKYMNFPRTHWANSGGGPGAGSALNTRDVILLIDNDVPWTSTDPPKTCKIISLDSDPLQSRCPMNGTPVHIPITCNSAKALPVLNRMCDEFITAERRNAFAERRNGLEAARKAADERMKAAIEKGKTEFPLNRAWISECIRQVSDENTVLLWDIGGIGGISDRTQPGHAFQLWGASLGTSWARGIGVKLAAPDKTVIASGGDGCALYSEPIACLQLARMYNAPMLYCVSNNNRHAAVQGGLARYGEGSYAARSGYIGSAIAPSPDFAGIAKAVGAYGEKVTRPDQVQPALQRALAAVKGGQAAVLDFITVKE
ncbi:MAG TPA: thiamine pyrophosphate-dependent enzyme [Dehalococcoidales bacterium]|nr:thiamine pyrophosphate-dependent enzyme [Dehalococcoidales bacterium]